MSCVVTRDNANLPSSRSCSYHTMIRRIGYWESSRPRSHWQPLCAGMPPAPKTRSEQRAAVQSALRQGLAAGQTWYVIPRKWFATWKVHVGYDSNNASASIEALSIADGAGGDDVPGEIPNDELIAPTAQSGPSAATASTGADGAADDPVTSVAELRRGLTEGVPAARRMAVGGGAAGTRGGVSGAAGGAPSRETK